MSKTTKKYQVFISSTYNDLKKERLAAQEAVLKTRNLPVGMEQFSASERKQWDLIVEDIDDSDYYVLIIGEEYGSEVPSEGISWTQKEFKYAVDKGIPVLSFIKKKSAKTSKADEDTDSEIEKKLNVFIAEAKAHSTVDFWKNKSDLKFKVAVALEKAIKDTPRPGWVRSRSIKPRKQNGDSYEEKALNYLALNGVSSTTKVAKELNISPDNAKTLLQDLLKEGKVQQLGKQRSVRWQVLKNKDDLVSYDDYRMHLLDIMDQNDHIIMCGCGTHFWENDYYSDELVSEIIQELTDKGLYNPSDDEIVRLAIKDILDEADPTSDECPGCGMPPRRIDYDE